MGRGFKGAGRMYVQVFASREWTAAKESEGPNSTSSARSLASSFLYSSERQEHSDLIKGSNAHTLEFSLRFVVV